MISVFGGTGFIGSEFCKNRADVVMHARDDHNPACNDIVYFISTTDNFNVFTNPCLDVETNILTLMSVLRNCKAGSTINFISTYFVYGDVPLPVTENSYCEPKGFYSITKRAAEQLLVSYCKTIGLEYRILRLSNVVGKTDSRVSNKKNALQFLIQKLKQDVSIELYGGGSFLRDYIHVEDVIQAINLIVTSGNKNEIYNVGCGSPVAFKDVMLYAKEKLNSKSEIVSINPTDFHKISQVNSMYMDTSKLKALGFVPKYQGMSIIDRLL